MKRNLAVVLSVAIMIVPGVGSALETANKMQIVEGKAGTFEVLANDAEASAAAFWCGAGDYVLSELEEPDDTPILVIRPLGDSPTQPGVLSVEFTIEPTDAQTATSASVSEAVDDTVGATMTAFAAKDQCPTP